MSKNRSKDTRRLFSRNICTLVFEFLPTAYILLITYYMAQLAFQGVDMFPHFPHSVTFKVVSFVLSFCFYGFLLAASYSMGFCSLHRKQITYLYVSYVGIYIHRWWDLGDFAEPLAAVGFGLGVLLIIEVIYKLIIRRTIHIIRKKRK